jgi:hypothetical protein
MVLSGSLTACSSRSSATAGSAVAAQCSHPDPRAYAGSECYSLAAALKLHGLVVPASATSIGFKVAAGGQLWLSFTDSPAGLAEFVKQSRQCTPVSHAGLVGIDSDQGDAVGWPFDKYLANIYSAQALLNCEGGTADEDDRMSVYAKSPTVDIVYWYSQSMDDTFN